MSIHITGIGWVTPSGAGSIKTASSFHMDPGTLPDLPTKPLGPSARRMDTLTRLALTAIGHCLSDAGLTESDRPCNIGLVAATEYACLDTDSRFFGTVMASGGAGASPGLFSYTLPSSFLGDAAIQHRLTGPTYVICDGDLKGIACLEMCLESILWGETGAMLCGIVNPPAPPVLADSKPLATGALFLMLKDQPPAATSYGILAFDREANVQFKGVRVDDISQIVQICLGNRIQSNT